MNIVVAVKQVPEITDVQINPKTGTLIREGVASIINPFCEYALDHAVRLKNEFPDIKITAISMGPPQAKQALMRAMELGADEAFLVNDRKFAGSDTWATALTLAHSIRHAVPDFDLIFVGKQAIDGDTAQVGPELAEILTIAQISYGIACRFTQNMKKIQVRKENATGYQVIETRLPALVSFSKGEPIARIPSFDDILCARRKPFKTISAKELNIPDDDLGLSGSFTQVTSIFPPPVKNEGQLFKGLDPDQAGKIVAARLFEQQDLFKKEANS
jgi:electron transfer flavoprotein beta subunit